uniref:Uncharacterized protein n=1 Tax=Ananas comosus var. bracteatus TaxID=296719 RepID=A0A6V7PIJ6_ANACO|nr:unnamed protein product [Ananas comosus var. bracteatus]
MADILHYYDLNQASSSWKSSRKLRGNGFEAPRNSFDFAAAASHMHYVFDENVPVLHRQRKISYADRGTATMKKLIDDEMSNRANERHDPPASLPGLMGMDPTPAKSNSKVCSKEIEAQKLVKSTAAKHAVNSNSYGSKRDSGRIRSVWSRATLREHPQEALLQKFKKDFEEWQASNVLKHSKALLAERCADKGKCTQILAQENLNKEKMARYADPKRRNSAQKKLLEPPKMSRLLDLNPKQHLEAVRGQQLSII